MQPSPYRPGQIADSVPGRERELFEANERLARLCDLGQLIGRIDVFTAARGFGKTSLLREVQRRAEERGAATAWVTAGEELGLVPALIGAVQNTTSGWREIAAVLPALEQARLSVNLGIAGAEATVHPRDDGPSPGSRSLERLLRDVVTAGRHQQRRALVLFVDEIQAADSAGLRTLAYAWQHLQAEGLDVPVAVFAAGLPDTSRTIVDAVSSSERFAYADLAPLTSAAIVEALAGPARHLGVDWAPDGLQLAIDAAAGYPFTVQLIGDHAWRIAGYPDSGALIDADVVRQATALTTSEMTRLIEDRFDRATQAERDVMVAMAQLGDGPVRRNDIAELLNVASSLISKQRDSLLKRGLIRAAGYGALEFTIPGMAAYLRERAASGPHTS